MSKRASIILTGTLLINDSWKGKNCFEEITTAEYFSILLTYQNKNKKGLRSEKR